MESSYKFQSSFYNEQKLNDERCCLELFCRVRNYWFGKQKLEKRMQNIFVFLDILVRMMKIN